MHCVLFGLAVALYTFDLTFTKHERLVWCNINLCLLIAICRNPFTQIVQLTMKTWSMPAIKVVLQHPMQQELGENLVFSPKSVWPIW